jgi:hypothetical protein
MKITGFNPSIITAKPDSIINLFEELGFERQHNNNEVDERTAVRMKNESGFHVDVVQNESVVPDMTTIRINVDNLDEARNLLKSHGFTESARTADTNSAQALSMTAPSGFVIILIEHKKNHD